MSKPPRSPKSTLKVRRSLPKTGDEVWIKATVTRTGRNSFDTADTITLKIGDHPAPVTASAKYVLDGYEDD